MLASFALAVEHLARRDRLLPRQIAAKLNAPEPEVWEAMRLLAVPVPDEIERPVRPSQEVRASVTQKVPQKWREHYRR